MAPGAVLARAGRSVLSLLVSGALILCGAGALVVDAGLRSPARLQVVGGNLPVNVGATDLRDISSHNSPSLVRSPRQPANLAVANRIDTPAASCALHVSSDSGVTWVPVPLPVPEGEEPKCFAPEAAFGADGMLYVLYVTLAGAGNVPNHAWLVESADGGRTLSSPKRVTPVEPFAFQVRLTADPAVAGRIYVTWLQASSTTFLGLEGDGHPILFARSDDAGSTWAGPRVVSATSRREVLAPSLAVGPRGELYALYLDLGDDRLDYTGAHQGRGGPAYEGTWSLVLARSLDRGATWSETAVERNLIPAFRLIVFVPPSPTLAVDPSSGRIYVTFHDRRQGDADVWLWLSDDAGASFGAARRVNDTPRGDGTSQYLPALAVAGGGRLDVVYYDRRADPADIANEVSLQSSFDGGRSFTPRTRLSDRPFDSRIGLGSDRGLPDLGSRLAVLSTPRQAYAVWADTRAGTQASNKQDLVRSLVAVTGPSAPSPLASIALRSGSGAILLGLILAGRYLIRRRHNRPQPATDDAIGAQERA